MSSFVRPAVISLETEKKADESLSGFAFRFHVCYTQAMRKIKKAGALFSTAYLLIMFCIYPFYMQNGYVDIGEAKIRFFLLVSLAALGILGVLSAAYLSLDWIRRWREKEAYFIDWERVSVTDLLVMLFATEVFLSYVFSSYREEALWGTEGWRIGCIPILLLCGLYFLLSRLWRDTAAMSYGIMAASGAVFLLGICNRFSVYPISFDIVQSDFISTLGNINWYCGFLSVIAPVGIMDFMLGAGEGRAFWREGVSGGYAVLAFMAGFSQGSSSVFVWFAALLLSLLWIVSAEKVYRVRLLVLIVLWGISAQMVRLLRLLFPKSYHYDTDALCSYFTDSSLSLWIAGGIVLCILFLGSLQEKDEAKWGRRIKGILLAVVLSSAAAGFLLTLIHTRWGIPFLKEDSIFYFDADWGNGRGATLTAGWAIWKELSFGHKLLGVGPDCFSACAYEMPELAASLFERFGSARLTNAHCELVTLLINTGILGVVFYIGIFVSFMGRCLKAGKRQPYLYMYGVCVFCYLCHNIVSFAQVLNFPFVFLLMGMGESIYHGSRPGTPPKAAVSPVYKRAAKAVEGEEK